MHVPKAVSTISLVQEKDGQVEDPGRRGHPPCGSAQLGDRVVGRHDSDDLEDAVSVHKIQVDRREGEKEVGPVERLVGRPDWCRGNKVGAEEVAQWQVDTDHCQQEWDVVAESCVLAVTVVDLVPEPTIREEVRVLFVVWIAF